MSEILEELAHPRDVFQTKILGSLALATHQDCRGSWEKHPSEPYYNLDVWQAIASPESLCEKHP